MNDKYSITLIWSAEAEAYIARVAELPRCFADGATAEEAVEAVHLVIEDWIEEARRLGRPIPQPLTTQTIEQMATQAAEQFRAYVQGQVDLLVEQTRQKLELNPALASHDPADFWKRGV